MGFSVTSYWPHAILVSLLALLGSRDHARFKLLSLAVALGFCVALLYQLLDNGVAPPESSGAGQLFALSISCVIPPAGTVMAAHELRTSKLSRLARVSGALLTGLTLTMFMPGLQMLFGCSFSGICP
jgi:hypothetical protein